MHITIHIDDGKSTTVTTAEVDKNALSTAAAGNGIDGGAPKFSGAGGSSGDISGSDTTDIGGPPQWLTEAMGREGQVSIANAVTDPGSGGAGLDAGAGPAI